MGGWKKRWFVLRVEKNGCAVLAYYRKQADASPAGEIPLDQSTLAYHNVDSDKANAFNIKTEGRTYEILAGTRIEMMEWIEILMEAALGIQKSAKKVPAAALETMDTSVGVWLRFEALGMACECCWELLPQALRGPGVEVVRIDASADTVSLLTAKDADLEAVVQRATRIMEEDFGFLPRVLSV